MRDRTRALDFFPLLLAALLLIAAPATAQMYTITLQDGTSFTSRYAPREAEWDANMVLVMTEMGNTIGIPRADIAEAMSDLEALGFGRPIDAVTVDLGWAANDLPLPGSESSELQNYRDIQSLTGSGRERVSDTQQFVSPNRAGQSGGFPVGGDSEPVVPLVFQVPPTTGN